jgi:hypothetical protein
MDARLVPWSMATSAPSKGPSQQCPQPGQELIELERLDQVVIRTGIEALDPIAQSVASGQHQHRHLEVVESRCPDHLDSGLLGHAPVDDGRGVVVHAQQVERVSAVLCGVDHVATFAKPPDEQVPDWSLIRCHQEAHHSIILERS